jgi:predicted dehydrogenase
VLCEKPLAISVEQGTTVVARARAAARTLGVAYRTQYSPHHREFIRLAREQTFGVVECMRVGIGFGIDDDWRLSRALAGGGVLLEQGVYAVNAARSVFGGSPAEVFAHQATSDPGRFSEVEESVIWTMRFANGEIAQCAASYSMPMNALWAGASSGAFELDPAFTYGTLEGSTSAGAIEAESVNQFVAQLEDVAGRIQSGTPLERNSGEEGLEDIRVIEAIYQSIRERRPIALS